MSAKSVKRSLVLIFAANIRRRRLELGLSQEAFAERAGVHRTYIGMLERGEKNVTIYNIEKIALALGRQSLPLAYLKSNLSCVALARALLTRYASASFLISFRSDVSRRPV